MESATDKPTLLKYASSFKYFKSLFFIYETDKHPFLKTERVAQDNNQVNENCFKVSKFDSLCIKNRAVSTSMKIFF